MQKYWYHCDLNTIAYNEALAIQKKLVEAVTSKRLDSGIILMLEHPPVFTLGKRGGKENIAVSEDFLYKKDIRIVETERGGNVTYHGPGQLVVYFIIPLERFNLKVVSFVETIEEIMIDCALDFGVQAGRNSINHGVWVENKKLGSIGIAIRKGVSFHGLALNINNDLTPFQWINACGLKGVAMTSLSTAGHMETSVEAVKESMKNYITAAFHVSLKYLGMDKMKTFL